MGTSETGVAGAGLVGTAYCPFCRVPLAADSICGDCGADFTKSQSVVRRAEALRELAIRLWRGGHVESAMACMAEAKQLKGDALTIGLLEALTDLNLARAIDALSRDGPQAALYVLRQILAVRPHHGLARSLQGFVRGRALP